MFFALAFRLWGVGFGLPDLFHPDEQKIVSTALGFGSGDLNPHFFRYPTFYIYIQFFLYGIYYALGAAFGFFNSSYDFAFKFYSDPTNVYLIGRTSTAILGAAIIIPVFLVGKRLFGAFTGLLATAFTAFSFLLIQDSHFITTDIPVTFLIMICAYFSIEYLYRGKKSLLYFSAIFAGLAASTKYNGGLSILIPLAGLWVASSKKNRLNLKELLAPGFLVGIIALVFFIAGAPFILLDFKKFLMDLTFELSHAKVGHFGFYENQSGFLFHITKSLGNGIGLPLTFIGMISGFYLLLKPKKESWILALFFAAYFFLISLSSTMFQRYAIPLIPFIALFASYAITIFTGKFFKNNRLKIMVCLLFAAIIILPNIIKAVRHDLLLSRQDTRTTAKKWILENVGTDLMLAIDPYGPKVLVRDSESLGSDTNRKIKDKIKSAVLAKNPGYKVMNIPYHHLPFDMWLEKNKPAYVLVSGYMASRIEKSRHHDSRKFLTDLTKAMVLEKTISPYKPGVKINPDDFDMKCLYSPCVERLFVTDRPGPVIRIFKQAKGGK